MMYVIAILFGLLLGSFLNAWVYRTRNNHVSILTGRSVCPQCKNILRFFDNIPLLSFVLLKGVCRFCKKPISKQYPIIEACTAILFLSLTGYHLSIGSGVIEIIRDCILVFFLVFIFAYDFLYQEIWDRATTIPALIYIPCALFFSWQTWQSMLLGAVIGTGFFLSQFLISKGKWVGGGDIRLGFFMGVVLGFPKVLLALFIAYVLGALWSVLLVLFKYKHIKDTTAFGTYLTIGTFVTLLYGESIVSWYASLLL